jgi:hypothetical protein
MVHIAGSTVLNMLRMNTFQSESKVFVTLQVGWHLKKLVAALKDNKKEVTLTLKKRPHHVNPFGPHMNRRKVPKNVKQSTFPKAFRRKSREEKSGRPPLKDFLNSMPVAFTKDTTR